MVNILNVYDTVYGNTQEIAEYFEKHLGRKEHAIVTLHVSKVRDELIQKADFFLVGSPTHYWKPTKEVARFIARIYRARVNGRYALVYDTRKQNVFSGNASAKMAKMLLSLKFRMMSKGECFMVESTKGPLKLGEIHKMEMLAARTSSFIQGLDIENLHAPGFVP